MLAASAGSLQQSRPGMHVSAALARANCARTHAHTHIHVSAVSYRNVRVLASPLCDPTVSRSLARFSCGAAHFCTARECKRSVDSSIDYRRSVIIAISFPSLYRGDVQSVRAADRGREPAFTWRLGRQTFTPSADSLR